MSFERWLPSVRLDARGMERLLGALEAEIMQVLWQRGESTAPEVRAALGNRVALNTVATVLSRLAAKDLVERRGQRRPYRFRPLFGRDEFVAAVARELVAGMVEDFGDAAAVAFIEAALSDRDGGYRSAPA